MVIPLVGKLTMSFITLAVIAGMSTVVIFVVRDAQVETNPNPSTTPPPDPVDPDILYRVGVGIADMTGPPVEITFMGYAELGQTGQGIHLRQFSRAFIFVRGNTRIVLVTAEVQAIGIAVRREVVKNLQELYGDIYTLQNVILTGTHTHSAPGGHLVDFLLDVTILGFSSETFKAYVDGITRSIVRAHENMVPARLYVGSTSVPDAHMNRSPYSYERNPDQEKARYEGNTDDELTQLRIVRPDGGLHGVLSWFSVHTTSMNMTNHLVSSDNLGYSALRMEKELNPNSPTGKPSIVSGFFSSSLGDISPNTRGARCEFSGDECDNQFQLCAAFERCYSLGPGDDMFESTRLIGNAVYEAAMQVLRSPGEELRGELAVRHQFVEVAEETVPRYDPLTDTFDLNTPVSGCVPSMGYSFASGTIDGANVLNITQGTISNNPLLDAISAVVARPLPADVACHAPKPILLATGRANFPIPWHPRIVSASLIYLGGLAIAGIPGEPTTMAGRRVQRLLKKTLMKDGVEPRVVVSGLTNEYIHYVATFEEYQVQRYEAASTIYGPHTLNIFLHKFQQLALAAVEGSSVAPGPEPEDVVDRTISLIPPVLMDAPLWGTNFGDVVEQPPSVVRAGDTVTVTFVGANPRNDLRQESSYLYVERLELGQWITVATDADWDTRFYWERESTVLGTSRVRVEWRPPSPPSLPPRRSHRVRYCGTARSLLGTYTPFCGHSDTFILE